MTTTNSNGVRGNLSPMNALQNALQNLVMSRETEKIKIPTVVEATLDDMLWKFDGFGEPKKIVNCEAHELLQIVQSLIKDIQHRDLDMPCAA